jgi:hypothetical protein
MTKTPLLIVLAVAIAIIPIWFFGFVNVRPKPMSIEQCRAALGTSTEFRKFLDNMDETNRLAAYETGAMRCVLDRDPETASWPEEKNRYHNPSIL